jgi:hypothetical protein
MKRYLHLLWFEVLRLKWALLWLLGLLAVEGTIRAWLVFGPVWKNWPEVAGLGAVHALIVPTVSFLSLALFLEHSSVGLRSSIRTQAIPPLLFPVVKLSLFAFLFGLGILHSSLVDLIHGEPSAAKGPMLTGVAALCVVFAWLAAQSETPAGIAKHAAFWAAGIGLYLLLVSAVNSVTNRIAALPEGGPGDPFLALFILAPPVIALQYIRRRAWLRIAASVIGILLLFDAPYWTFLASPAPASTSLYPTPPDKIEGQATITELSSKTYYTELGLRLDPGLLAASEFAIIATATLQTGKEPIYLTSDSYGYDTRHHPGLHRNCLSGDDLLLVRQGFEGGRIPTADIWGGEAVLCVFRLVPIPGQIKPDQSDVTFRVNGRNARLSLNREVGLLKPIWIRTGFESSKTAEPWRQDILHPGPTLIRATAPGSPPLWIELPPGITDQTTSGFKKRVFVTDEPMDSLRSRQLEFFEDQYVRLLRVRLIPGPRPSVP